MKSARCAKKPCNKIFQPAVKVRQTISQQIMWRKKLKNKRTNKCCPYWAVPSGGSATGLKLLTLCLGFCCSKGLIGTPVRTEKFKNCCNLCCYMEEKQQGTLPSFSMLPRHPVGPCAEGAMHPSHLRTPLPSALLKPCICLITGMQHKKGISRRFPLTFWGRDAGVPWH